MIDKERLKILALKYKALYEEAERMLEELEEDEGFEETDPAYHGPDINKPYKDFYR